MNNANMIEVFDAVTGGTDGSASVDNWKCMSLDEVRVTAEGMADNCYEPLSSEELDLVTKAIAKAQKAERGVDFELARMELNEE